MNAVKISFLIAIAGHLLCGVCDCLLTYLPGGRFRFEDMKDNDRLSAAFRDMPLRNPQHRRRSGCSSATRPLGRRRRAEPRWACAP